MFFSVFLSWKIYNQITRLAKIDKFFRTFFFKFSICILISIHFNLSGRQVGDPLTFQSIIRQQQQQQQPPIENVIINSRNSLENLKYCIDKSKFNKKQKQKKNNNEKLL